MKNWTVKEAVAVINAGTDTEAIKEIVKHFPLFAVIAARKDFDALAAAMPENLTVRKVENELNSDVTETTEVDDVEEGSETGETGEAGEYEGMSKSDLIALCEKRKIKVQKYQKPKQYYIDALNAASEQGDAEEGDDAGEEDPVALYKQCKKAGLSVKPKQSAKYYKDALAKAAAVEEEAEEEEDWDDEEEEAPAPKKAKKAPVKKEKAAKPAKKAKEEVEEDVEEEDDDDDWDI